jgi:hypothetical protein
MAARLVMSVPPIWFTPKKMLVLRFSQSSFNQPVYGEHRYPGLLVIQDVRTLHGSQFKNATLIVTAAQNYRRDHAGIKLGGDWFNASQPSISRTTSSKSDSRKAASAMIAKIPLPLSSHIGRVFKEN